MAAGLAAGLVVDLAAGLPVGFIGLAGVLGAKLKMGANFGVGLGGSGDLGDFVTEVNGTSGCAGNCAG